MKPDTADKTLELGRLILKFAETYRATRFPDGVTPESDTDHTVMLGIIACALAKEYEPRYDLGTIAQFALVHDFVEVYAGDTDTFGIHKDEERKSVKDQREAEALARLEKEFGSVFPWITETIHAYESLETPEARFVKAIDKILPKITHTLNKGVVPPSIKDFEEHCAHQREVMRNTYGRDQEFVLELYEVFTAKVLDAMQQSKRPEA